ncbi:lysoplasmalogenase family protein [Anaeromicropila populeti]|uniref:YhhN-like protein n=1 Tax=Anaeromicropila populeti TaxID=37658 RepID=A0A1I6IQ42_9FIRM|nr:lysoplasmalogenase family protein [Anaeromicropila populeti]SFR68370.1 YhhN-like protein [Anaeromicropila populeti]
MQNIVDKGKKYFICTVTGIFLLIEAVIYVAFLSLDIANSHSDYSTGMKFIGISLCLFYSIICFLMKEDKNLENNIVTLAITTTVIADVFLLLLNRHYTIGLLFFNITQVCYGIKIYLSRRKKGSLFFIIRFVTFLALIWIVGWRKVSIDLLVLLTGFYFVNLFYNVIGSCLQWKKNVLFAVGMLLFLCCDIQVGIFNISQYISIEGELFKKLFAFSQIGMWLFYLPSQVLLTLSNRWSEK